MLVVVVVVIVVVVLEVVEMVSVKAVLVLVSIMAGLVAVRCRGLSTKTRSWKRRRPREKRRPKGRRAIPGGEQNKGVGRMLLHTAPRASGA